MAKTYTETITIYSFGELLTLRGEGKATSKAVDRAREWLREDQTDHDWWDYTYDTWKQALEQIGLTNVDIRFRGFWSQGDGASFTADVDWAKFIGFLVADIPPIDSITFDGVNEDFRGWIVHKCLGKIPYNSLRRLIPIANHLEGGITRWDHRESGMYTCKFDVSLQTYSGHHYNRLEALVGGLNIFGEDFRKNVCRAIYTSLREECEYLESDEQLVEASDANGYGFTIDGKREGWLNDD